MYIYLVMRFLKRNMLIIKLKENFKSEPFDAVVEWT